jgi:hypothetical protein
MRNCKSCGREFDENAFGTLRKHCSMMCRNTKGGTLPIDRKPGKPRKWSALSAGQKALVVDDLTERGWKLSYTAYPGVVLARKGWWSVSIALGALEDRRHEQYPQTFAQFNSGNIVYKSACTRNRIVDGNEYLRVKKVRVKRTACGKCRKCVSTAWVNSRPTPVYRGKLETNCPPLDGVPGDAYTEDHG